jgi:hypothetical protein
MTTLTHTPAHTTSHPDRFENEGSGWGYSVLQDTDAEDPRTWNQVEDVALWAYREPTLSRSIAASKPAGNLVIDAFARFYEHFDAETALTATRRYLAIFHPGEKFAVRISTITGYAQGDWLEMVAAVREGHGSCEGHLENFRRWAFGDVWVVLPDGRPGIRGIYADDAEDALAYFRENFEDEGQSPETEPGEKPARAENTTLPEPDFVDERLGIRRWHCSDGAVVTDLGSNDPGVHLYTSQSPDEQSRKLADARQLAASLLAAHRALHSHTPRTRSAP